MTTGEDGNVIRSLARGLRVLRAFEGVRNAITLTEIAERVELALPTVYRIVQTLETEGFLIRTDERTYVIDPSVGRLGAASVDDASILRASGSHLRSLANKTDETINLGVLEMVRVRYLDRIRNADLVTADISVGSLLPASCTSMGKLLLANLPDDVLAVRLPELDLAAGRGPRAIRTEKELLKELQNIRDRGWALQDEELAYGLRSVAAPVHGPNSVVLAAINLAVLSTRWTTKQLISHFLSDLQETARSISISFVAPSSAMPSDPDSEE